MCERVTSRASVTRGGIRSHVAGFFSIPPSASGHNRASAPPYGMPRNALTTLRIPARLLRTIAGLALGMSLVATSATAAPTAKPTATPTAGPAVAGPYSAAKAPVSVSKARAHKFRPANTVGAIEADDGNGVPLVAKEQKVHPVNPKLDITLFSDTLHAALNDKVRGYSMVVRKNDALAAHVIWDYAKSPTEGNKGWTIDTRMHIASVSKLLTAMAIVDLLDEQGIAVDAKIGPYLPEYWNVGNNVADITFRDLMRHRSGFASEDSDGSFPAMKREVARNVPTDPKSDYANVNFSLLRVLGATLAGWVPADTEWDAEINDAMWDIATTQWFIARVNTKILAPSGVAAMSPVPSGDSAYAYGSRTDDTGWNSGDVTTQLGGVGFRLSPNEVAKVLGTFRRSGKIVSDSVAKSAIEGHLGLNGSTDTPAGKVYYRKGGWGGSDIEKSLAYYMPGNIEIVLFVNSPIGPEDASMRLTVENAYINSLK